MKEYYIDLGSSTIKTYVYENYLKLLEEHSIYFKNGFTEENGISEENKKELYAYFNILKNKYNLEYANTHILATGIFRNLKHNQRQELVTEFNRTFDLHFEVISHGIENYYLGKAMENDYSNEKILIINMGGKTTELVTFENNKIIDRKNLTIGVADLLNAFPTVNNKYSAVTIEEINAFVKEKISNNNFDNDYDGAIFTGGEERFELLTKFNLVANNLFDDKIHKYMVTYDDYVKGTNNVFFKLSLDDLYALLPSNPKWMDGARVGAVLPLAIFDLADIKYIVPSDLNLINGVINDLQ